MVRLLVVFASILFLISGCSQLNDENSIATQAENNKVHDTLVRVQDYTGEGYTLRNGNKSDKIAQENKEEITEAVEKFFLEKYKTEVMVHNMVGAAGGVSVYVESIGEPHFYTFAIVPIDVSQKKIHTDKVWSQEGQVENAIKTALFAMVFEEEIAVLNSYLKELSETEPITGRTKEALERVSAAGYATPFYFANTSGDEFDILLEQYLMNPDISKNELQGMFTSDMYTAKRVIFTIYLYMNEPDLEPDDQLFQKIVKDIEAMEGLAKGSYSVLLNDNFIDKTSGVGFKDNSLERGFPNNIINE